MTKYVIKSKDIDEHLAYLQAPDMRIAIDTMYDACLRNYIKHGVDKSNTEITDEQLKIVEEIHASLTNHFHNFLV